MPPKTDRVSVEQQLSDYQVPEPVCATVRALLTKVERRRKHDSDVEKAVAMGAVSATDVRQA